MIFKLKPCELRSYLYKAKQIARKYNYLFEDRSVIVAKDILFSLILNSVWLINKNKTNKHAIPAILIFSLFSLIRIGAFLI